jgi:hypothetical protein
MVCPVRLTPGFVLSHCPTQNRFALLLEMLFLSHCPAQNRFALLLEML